MENVESTIETKVRRNSEREKAAGPKVKEASSQLGLTKRNFHELVTIGAKMRSSSETVCRRAVRRRIDERYGNWPGLAQNEGQNGTEEIELVGNPRRTLHELATKSVRIPKDECGGSTGSSHAGQGGSSKKNEPLGACTGSKRHASESIQKSKCWPKRPKIEAEECPVPLRTVGDPRGASAGFNRAVPVRTTYHRSEAPISVASTSSCKASTPHGASTGCNRVEPHSLISTTTTTTSELRCGGKLGRRKGEGAGKEEQGGCIRGDNANEGPVSLLEFLGQEGLERSLGEGTRVEGAVRSSLERSSHSDVHFSSCKSKSAGESQPAPTSNSVGLPWLGERHHVATCPGVPSEAKWEAVEEARRKKEGEGSRLGSSCSGSSGRAASLSSVRSYQVDNRSGGGVDGGCGSFSSGSPLPRGGENCTRQAGCDRPGPGASLGCDIVRAPVRGSKERPHEVT